MDRRDYMNEFGESLQEGFDKDKMVWRVEMELDETEIIDGIEYYKLKVVELPAKFVVCDTCGGKGKHVNPSIDSHGLSYDDFAEDPDFAEEYFRGTYDVTCYECGGNNVVGAIDEDLIEKAKNPEWDEAFKYLQDEWQENADYARCVEAERRMGA